MREMSGQRSALSCQRSAASSQQPATSNEQRATSNKQKVTRNISIVECNWEPHLCRKYHHVRFLLRQLVVVDVMHKMHWLTKARLLIWIKSGIFLHIYDERTAQRAPARI